jgi:sugar phosphate isomerase/epimerase
MYRPHGQTSRRKFLLGGAAALTTSTAHAQLPAAGRPKIGCVSWCFHGFDPGADPTEAINIMGRIGFEGTDLILLGREDIARFWTDGKIDDLRRRLERNRLAVAQFVVFQPVIEGLTSRDAEERKRNLDYFEAGCRIGKKLGAPIVDIVAPWPRELRRPRSRGRSSPSRSRRGSTGTASGRTTSARPGSASSARRRTG